MADRVQMEQVLINLLSNARDAIANRVGKVTVSINAIAIDDEYIRLHGFGRKGEYAVISCADNGMGMERDLMDHMFEPFFDIHKSDGKGLGLGLSIVYGIVSQHEGYMRAESKPDKGSVFYIYLPLAEQGAQRQPLNENIKPSGGSETILLAEDDSSLRAFAKGVLEDVGYTVVDVDNGEDAMRYFISHADSIDLLLLDVVMPGMNGIEVYDRLHAVRPDIKVLFSSGYSEDLMERRGLRQEDHYRFIKKPFSMHELLKAIREALGNRKQNS